MNHENAEKMLATLKELAQAATTHLVLDAALVRKHVATLYKIAIEESDSNDVVRSLANAQEMLDECIRRGPLLDESDLSKLDVAFSGLQESFRRGRRRSTSQAQ